MDAAVRAVGGNPRRGQQRMAGAVQRAMESGRHLLVQAGTGTGKSLGYLVPALARAVRTGKPVVVSTATIALQAQIVTKDLPRLVEALAPLLPRTPSFCLLKGRANYVCLHKVAGGYPDDIEPGALFAEASVHSPSGDTLTSERLGDQIRRLRDWAEQTDTGDRDALDMPVSDRAWRQVSVTGSQCLGTSCPMVGECFAERNRDIARGVDLIVTNHALLAVDAFSGHGIIPAHDVVVFDEAHELTARVTSAVTKILTHGAVRGAGRAVRQLGLPATALEEAGEALSKALGDVGEGRLPNGLPEVLTDALVVLEAEARQLHADARAAGDDGAGSTAGARKNARTALQEICDVARRVVDEREGDVVWISRGEANGRLSLLVAPLSIAGSMRSKILSQRTTVMTSATLAFADRFESPAGAVGLDPRDRRPEDEDSYLQVPDGENKLWSGIDVGSPFDYEKQGILYIARHLPTPGREGPSLAMLDHVVELVEASDGGVLGLFSSRRAAEAAAQHVRERSSLPIAVQGEDSVGRLVSVFRQETHTSLFGTLSLWQGVDVQGDACRLVLIDRIPFPRPDDPLTSARQEHISARGGNGFMSVSAQHAALLLAQGAGRLVRSDTDRGMVAVLDPRLATARYGGYLLSAMPPLWRTSDPEVALGALRRLSQSVRSR
nr:ATP-dependent DNA helicase [Devriesea agamarum]